MRDWPIVDRACQSALPIVFTDLSIPEYPGTAGSCFGVQLAERIVFLTAAHLVRSINNAKVEIPFMFGSERREMLQIAHVTFVEAKQEIFEDACDFAVMVPSSQPQTASPYFSPISIVEVADVDRMRSDQIYVVAGYPRHHPKGNSVDYERNVMEFQSFRAIGTYESASFLPGCHTLKLDTRAVGGAQGLSGSPVFRVTNDGKKCGLAGLVIRGNDQIVHFIGVNFIVEMLVREKHHLFAAEAGVT